MTTPAAELRERVRALPGMDRILGALDDLPRAFLVGGAVRDLLRGAEGVDLDLAVEGDGTVAAERLAERLGGQARSHERFGTARVRAEGLEFDVAATRSETYSRPGALPDVEPASLEEDLGRRDFSVNAMALGLSGDDLGRLHDPFGGRGDLEAGVVRVLHDGSFLDDPTRLLRALRYEARLDAAMEPGTDGLAREAVAEGALGTVSSQRVGEELLRLLAEQEAPAAVGRMAELGIDAALHPALSADADLVASAALGSAETGADRALAGLAALCSAAPGELMPWVESLGLPASQRDAVREAASEGALLARALREGERGEGLRASSIHALLRGLPGEALALALAHGAPPGPVLRYAGELRHTTLEIGGEDLLAAGVPESPRIGRALDETLRRKLDGELSGREQELAAALELAREGAA